MTGLNELSQFSFNLLFLNLWPLTLKRCIGIFSKIRYFVRQQVLIQLYYSLIYAFLAYSLINWGRPLIICQKKAVRIIIFSDYKSYSCPLLHEQRLLKLCGLIYRECFHSRGQHLCKFIGTKESVCIRKELSSHRIGLGHQYGRRDVMWKHSIDSAFFMYDLLKQVP